MGSGLVTFPPSGTQSHPLRLGISAPEGARAAMPPTQGTGQGLGTTPSASHGQWAGDGAVSAAG